MMALEIETEDALIRFYLAMLAAEQHTRYLRLQAGELLRGMGVGVLPIFPPTNPQPARHTDMATIDSPTVDRLPAKRQVHSERGALTISELANESGFSESTLRRLLRDEPGVLVIPHAETLHRRGYTSMRVPRDVADRVIARHARK